MNIFYYYKQLIFIALFVASTFISPTFTQAFAQTAPQIINITRAVPLTENISNRRDIIWHVEFNKQVILAANNFTATDNSNNPLASQLIEVGQIVASENENVIYPIILSQLGGYEGIVKLALDNNQTITDTFGNELTQGLPATAESFNIVTNAPYIVSTQRLDGNGGLFRETTPNYPQQSTELLQYPTASFRWRVTFSKPIKTNLTNAFTILQTTQNGTTITTLDTSTPEPNDYIITHNYQTPFRGNATLAFSNNEIITDQNDTALYGQFPFAAELTYEIYGEMTTKLVRHTPTDSNNRANSLFVEWLLTFGNAPLNFSANDLTVMQLITDPNNNQQIQQPTTTGTLTATQQQDPRQFIIRYAGYEADFNNEIFLQFNANQNIADEFGQTISGDIRQVISSSQTFLPNYTGELTSIEYINEAPIYIAPEQMGGADFYQVKFRFTFNLPVKFFNANSITADVAAEQITVEAVAPDSENYATAYIAKVRLPANYQESFTIIANQQTNFTGDVVSRNGATTINLPAFTQEFNLRRPASSKTATTQEELMIYNITRIGSDVYGSQLHPTRDTSQHVTGARAMGWVVEFSHPVTRISPSDFQVVTNNNIVAGDITVTASSNRENSFEIVFENYQTYAKNNLSGDDPYEFTLAAAPNNHILSNFGTALAENLPMQNNETYLVHPILHIVEIERLIGPQITLPIQTPEQQIGWWVEYNRPIASPPATNNQELFQSNRYKLRLSIGQTINLKYRASIDDNRRHWVTTDTLPNNSFTNEMLQALIATNGNVKLIIDPEYVDTAQRNHAIAIPNRNSALYTIDPISLPDQPILPNPDNAELTYIFGDNNNAPVVLFSEAVGNDESIIETPRPLRWRFTFSHRMRLPAIDDFELVIQDLSKTTSDEPINQTTQHPKIIEQLKQNTTIRRSSADNNDIIYEIDADGLRGLNATLHVRILPNNNLRALANNLPLASTEPVFAPGNLAFRIGMPPALLDVVSSSNRNFVSAAEVQGVDANTHKKIKIIQALESDRDSLELYWDFTFSSDYGHSLDAENQILLSTSLVTSKFNELFAIRFENLPAPADGNPSRTKRVSLIRKIERVFRPPLQNAYIVFEIASYIENFSNAANIPAFTDTAFLVLTSPTATLTTTRRRAPIFNDTVEVENFPYDTTIERTELKLGPQADDSLMVFQVELSHEPMSIDKYDFAVVDQLGQPVNSAYAEITLIDEIEQLDTYVYEIYVDIPQGFDGEQEMRIVIADNHNLYVPMVNLNWQGFATAIPPKRFETDVPINTDFKKQNQGFLVDTYPVLENVERILPTSETATDVRQLGWRFTFSESITTGTSGSGLDGDDFQLLTNGAPNNSFGTLNVQHTNGEATAIVTLTADELLQFDGTIQAKFAGGLASEQLPTDQSTLSTNVFSIATPLRMSQLGTVARQNPTHDTFTVTSIPTATIYRRSGTDGEIRAQNPMAIWEIEFSENVIFNANAYNIIQAPQGTTISKQEINPRLHRITANLAANNLLTTTIDLAVEKTLLLEQSRVQPAKHVASISGETQYAITSAVAIHSIRRINAASTVDSDLTNAPLENHPRWRVQFSENVSNLSASDFKIVGNPATLPPQLELRQYNIGDNFIEVAPYNLHGYDGTLTLRLIDQTPFIASGELSLISNSMVQFENQNTISYKLPPRIASISHSASDATITWQINFTEAVQNVDLSDFTITPSSPIVGGAIASTIASNPNAPTNTSWLITTTGIENFDGNITFGIQQSHAITDFATPPTTLANLATAGTPDQRIFSKSNIAPELLAISRLNPSSESVLGQEVEWSYEFSEPVQNFAAENININATQTIVYETIHLTNNNNGTIWNHKIRITNGFSGTATLTPNIIDASLITDYSSTTTLPLVTPNITPQTYTIDPPLQILSLSRLSPTTETATNQNEVTWQYVFSETPFANTNATPITSDAFTISNANGTISMEAVNTNYIITFGNYNSLDGEITIALDDTIIFVDSSNQPLVATTPQPNENSFTLANGAIASIVRQSTINEVTQSYAQNDATINVTGENPSLSWLVSFNELVFFNEAAYTVVPTPSNASVSIVPVSANEHKITVDNFGEFQATVDLVIDASQLVDIAGNALDAGKTFGQTQFALDSSEPSNNPPISEAPTLTLTRQTTTSPNAENANAVVWNAQFSKPVANFNENALTLGLSPTTESVQLSVQQITAQNYNITASGYVAYEGTITININPAHQIQSLDPVPVAFAQTLPSSENYFMVDTKRPHIETISQPVMVGNTMEELTLTWTITFNENVRNVDIGDFSIMPESIATISLAKVTDSEYQIIAQQFTSHEGQVWLQINDFATIEDFASNNVETATAQNGLARIDTRAVVVDGLYRLEPFTAQPTNLENVVWEISFSENISNIDATDFIITANPATANAPVLTIDGSDEIYTISANTPDNYEGTLTIDLAPNNDIQELDGENNLATTDLAIFDNQFAIDTKAPTIENIETRNPTTTSIEWQINFSEPVRFTSNYIIVRNENGQIMNSIVASMAQAQQFQTAYTITVSDYGNYEGEIVLELSDSHQIIDRAGNFLTQEFEQSATSIVVDNNAPQIEQIRWENPNRQDVTNQDQVAWRIVFSENINALTSTDISITTSATMPQNIEIAQAQPNNNQEWIVQVVDIDPNYQGTIMLNIDSQHNIRDNFENRLSATEPQVNQNMFRLRTTTDNEAIIAATNKAVIDYIQKRARQILDVEPQINKPNQYAFVAENDSYNFSLANKFELDNSNNNIWVNINAVRSKDENARSQTKIAQLGFDTKYNEKTNFGLLFQYDNTVEKTFDAADKISGEGWLAGPYFNRKIFNKYDLATSLLWGQSENELNNSYKFDTSRELYQASIIGSKKINAVNFSPNLTIKYYSEQQKQFVGENDVIIPEQKYSLLRTSFGPSFSINQDYENFNYEIQLRLMGIYNFEKIKSSTQNIDQQDFTLQVKPGFTLRSKNGASLNINGFSDVVYDDIKSYGLTMSYILPF